MRFSICMVLTPGVIFLFIGTFVLSLAFFLGGCNGVVASIVAHGRNHQRAGSGRAEAL